MRVKWLAYLLSAIVVGLGILVLVSTVGALSQLSRLEVKDYLLLIQVIMTFITGLGLALYSSASSKSVAELNARLTREVAEAVEPLKAQLAVRTGEILEPLKAQLAVRTGEIIEPLKAQLAVQTGQIIEPLKARLASEVGESIETLKADLGQVVPRRYEAYYAMYDAATKYLKALRQFELKTFSRNDFIEAHAACEIARAKSLLALPEDVVEFDKLWQEANYIEEEGEKVANDPDALYALWGKEHSDFGNRYLELRNKFSNRLLS
jgi:hypothetical protein